MQSIFISYRRDDAASDAGRLHDDLVAVFGADRVFQDITGIGPGVKFAKVIDERIATCAVVLVVIGRRWLDKDSEGRRRIDSPADLVRVEAATALRRDGITVIPVLINGAPMPAREDLPEDLQQLVEHNAAKLSLDRWQQDVAELVRELKTQLPDADADDDDVPARPVARALRGADGGRRRTPWGLIGGVVAAIGVASAGGYVALREDPVKKAEDAARIAEAEARRVKAERDRIAAELQAAEDSKKLEQAASEQKNAEAKAAAIAASAADAAASQAEARRVAAANASAEEKKKADEEAARLAKEKADADAEAKRKADEAEAQRIAAENAKKEADAKARKDAEAQAELARKAQVVATANLQVRKVGGTKYGEEIAVARPVVVPAARPAGGSTQMTWRLKASCAGRDLVVSGPAVFSIERAGEGVIVSERFTGSGDGFEVTVTGKASFDKPQASYEIPTIGEWRGPRTFSSAGIDRVNTRDGQGLAVVSGNVIRFRANCPG